MAGAAVAVMLGLAACSTAVPTATRQAQAYAQSANLKLLDLPAGWSAVGKPTNSSVTSSTLNGTQSKTVHSLLSGLPAQCRSLDATFTASLVSAPPVTAIAQNQAQFTSASDGNAQISSAVAVFASLERSNSTYALYSAPSFTSCLQQFLHDTLVRVFSLSSAQVSVTTVPTPTPSAGVEATAFSVSQSGASTGSQTKVSAAEEVVMQSGKAMAFVEAQAASTSLPADALTVLGQSVAVVEHRLVPPPA